MSAVRIRTLNELRALREPEPKMEKLFDWYFEIHKLFIEVMAVSVGAFFAALIVAALKGDYAGKDWWWVVGVALILALGAGYSVRRSFLIMKGLEDEFVAAVKLLAKEAAP